jgi:hypothetical protein
MATSKCVCGRCPASRIERGLKCFSDLAGNNDGATKRRNGYSFTAHTSYARGWDLIGKHPTKIN